MSWQDAAACNGSNPELWFPDTSDKAGTEYAKAICQTCPVRTDCRDAHLDDEHGVFGGLSEQERAALRKRRGPAMCAADCGRPPAEPATRKSRPKFCEDCRDKRRRERKQRYEERVRKPAYPTNLSRLGERRAS